MKLNGFGRPFLANATIGTLTQGTIFTCAYADRYTQKAVWGLAITARCDVAQQKYRLLNYIPVVRLEDWFGVDGLEILVETERKEIDGKIKKGLKNAELSENILLSVSLDEICEAHFPTNADKKADREKAVAFRKLTEEKKAFDEVCQQSPDKVLNWFLKNRTKKIDDIVRRLSRQEITGFYFFERILADESPCGYVCLLREIGTIHRDIAAELARGMSKDQWKTIREAHKSSSLSFDVEDFAMPISCISSPTIEHLMQCFANLFGRIGLPDPIADDIEQIVNIICKTPGNL